MTDIIIALLSLFSLALTMQAAYTVYIMLYTWDRPEAYERAMVPQPFRVPHKSFAVLLPARHEEDVIQDTIERVVQANYPRRLVEIVVVCEIGDVGTIRKAEEKIATLRMRGLENVRLIAFDDKPINKPHGLNAGFRNTGNEVVTIFDAEDEIHPEIFNIVNTVMLQEGAKIVQSGVQLMNFDSSWYSTLNVLEYFFWFKSRLHYHASLGMIPLGGNTVFFAREVLDALGGWDESNLTEDADVGIRISVLGEKVRVVYDDEYVTKEETPPTLGQFVKQRTRWSQGFLQTLKKGDWKKLDSLQKRLLAVYTLAFPSVQAVLAMYVPVSVWMMFSVKLPMPVALLLLLPSYMVITHYMVSVVGLYEFAGAHGLRPAFRTPLVMLLTYIPYQWVLAYAALRATLREIRGINNWEKTAHVGAHRHGKAA
ncbi:MAG: glycosyltransferase [Chloroflexi bacterium]|nr:glycosyltransferase [Chloroflexota bacterium]